MRTLDTSHRINGTRCYGVISWATKGAAPQYEAYDNEQCHDCGGDGFRLIDHPAVLASMTGYALRCTKCGTIYPLRGEE